MTDFYKDRKIFFSKYVQNHIWPCWKLGQGQPWMIILNKFYFSPHLQYYISVCTRAQLGSSTLWFPKPAFLPFLDMTAISAMSPGSPNGCYIRILTSTGLLVPKKYVKIYLISVEYERPLLIAEPWPWVLIYSHCQSRLKNLVSIIMPASRKFFRGVPTFFFLVNEWIQMPLKSGHNRPASATPFKWRFAGMPMMAQHWMLAW